MAGRIHFGAIGLIPAGYGKRDAMANARNLFPDAKLYPIDNETVGVNNRTNGGKSMNGGVLVATEEGDRCFLDRVLKPSEESQGKFAVPREIGIEPSFEIMG